MDARRKEALPQEQTRVLLPTWRCEPSVPLLHASHDVHQNTPGIFVISGKRLQVPAKAAPALRRLFHHRRAAAGRGKPDDRLRRRPPMTEPADEGPSNRPLAAFPAPLPSALHPLSERGCTLGQTGTPATHAKHRRPAPGCPRAPLPSLSPRPLENKHTHPPPGGTHLVEVGVPGDVVAPLFDGQGPAAGSRAAPRLAAAAPADAEEKRPPAGPRHPQQAAHRHHRPAQRLLRARSGDGGGRGRRWPAGREGRGERAGRARRRCDRPGGPPPKRKATREADPASTPRRVAPPPLPVKAQPAAEGSGVEAGCPPGLHLRSAAGPEGRRLARPGLRFPAIAAPEGAPRPAAALRSSLLFPPCFLPLAFNEGHQERKAWAPAVWGGALRWGQVPSRPAVVQANPGGTWRGSEGAWRGCSSPGRARKGVLGPPFSGAGAAVGG